MNLKHLLISTTLCLATVPTAFAATYYVTPDGAGTKDGSSWKNAFGVAEFRTKAENNTNGDVYNFAGGLYNLSEKTVVFKVATGATLIGNADGERTIFSGDKNGNNNPGNGDAGRLIRFQANTVHGNNSNAIVVENIDFTCVFTNVGKDDTTVDGKENTAFNMAAFMVDNSGDVVVRGCRFYNNWADGNYGGAAAFLYRSTVKFVDCIFERNSANYRGGAIRIKSNHADKGITTLENCVVRNNKNYHNLGGAIFMGHGNSLNIINSTITGNSAVSDGAAIYFNGYKSDQHCEVRIVNSTIANNTTTNADDAQIVAPQGAHLNIANSIITSDDAVAAIKFKDGAASTAFKFVSGGYNYVGKIIDSANNELAWADTDNHGDDCTYAAIFGDNKLNADNVIVPAKFYLGATGEQVEAAVANWGIPAGVNYAVDQLGNERTGDVTPGAVAEQKSQITTAIETIGADARKGQLINLGGGLYAIEGAEAVATVYNLAGQAVAECPAQSIDLSAMQAGMYIIKSGNTIFKVIR